MSTKFVVYVQKVKFEDNIQLLNSNNESVYVYALKLRHDTVISDKSEDGRWHTTHEIPIVESDDLGQDQLIITFYNHHKPSSKHRVGVGHIQLLGHWSTNLSQAKFYPYTLWQCSDIKSPLVDSHIRPKQKVGTVWIKMGVRTERSATKVNVPTMEDAMTMSLQDIKLESIRTIDESCASVQRSVLMLDECCQIGQLVGSTVQRNQTQLDHVDHNLNVITLDLQEARRDLRSIHSIGSQIKNSMTSSHYSHDVASKSTIKSPEPLCPNYHSKSIPITSTIDLSVLELDNESQAKVDDIEAHVDTLSQMVKVLKPVSIDLGKVLDKQNAQLTKQTGEVIQTTNQVKRARQKVNREF